MSRKNLIPLLLDQAKSVTQLARELDMPPKDVENDLEHLLKSLKHMDYNAEVEPAQCRKCGFQFSTDKLRRPSRCPECKATWLTEPRLSIHAKIKSKE